MISFEELTNNENNHMKEDLPTKKKSSNKKNTAKLIRKRKSEQSENSSNNPIISGYCKISSKNIGDRFDKYGEKICSAKKEHRVSFADDFGNKLAEERKVSSFLDYNFKCANTNYNEEDEINGSCDKCFVL